MINLKLIKTLKPCQDRLDNYVKHYGKRSFTKRQFMGLKKITHEDKLWVAFRLIPKSKLGSCAADIAESVLHIFEAKYPNDKRPRLAIEAARRGGDKAATVAAYAAVYNADAAAYAAYAAAYANAAAYAAYAARANADAAANAAANAARANADAAAYAAYAAAYAGEKGHEKRIRTIILKHWK